MGALESRAEEKGRERAKDVRAGGAGGGEEINFGDGTRRWSAAERACLQIRVRARMMVVVTWHSGHCRHFHRDCRRTDL
jgi:hypothetical protein